MHDPRCPRCRHAWTGSVRQCGNGTTIVERVTVCTLDAIYDKWRETPCQFYEEAIGEQARA